jgi:D-alanyl-D-alanine carboxypeptidase
LCAGAVLRAYAQGAPDISARSAIVVEARSGAVLFEHDADTRRGMGSTTKIMTALVALEHAQLDDTVTVKPAWAGVEGSSIYLRANQTITMEDLLYGLLLVSGNDAAVTIAGHVAGGVPEFCELMNAKARELGCTNTRFANPHGLTDENHYTSARDMATIMRAAMQNETFARITGTKYHDAMGQSWKNHNKLLWDYEGCIGGKTGYTEATGRSLVTCVERDGVRVIAVTLYDGNDWVDHAALYNYAFGKFERVSVTSDDLAAVKIPVIAGERHTVGVVMKQTVEVTVRGGQKPTISVELPNFVYAVVVRGASAGFAEISVDGVAVERVPLYFAETVLRGVARRDSAAAGGFLRKNPLFIQGKSGPLRR